MVGQGEVAGVGGSGLATAVVGVGGAAFSRCEVPAAGVGDHQVVCTQG